MFFTFILCRMILYQQSLYRSIPDAPCPVMRQGFLPVPFQLLHGIIQVKVYQDCVDIRFGVLSLDLPPDQLDSPDTASPQLHLPLRPTGQDLLIVDRRSHSRTTVKRTKRYKYLRDAVVSKHSDFANVVKATVVLAVETGPDVRYEDLGPFKESDWLVAAFVKVFVAETLEVFGEGVDEAGSGAFGRVDQVCYGTTVALMVVSYSPSRMGIVIYL